MRRFFKHFSLLSCIIVLSCKLQGQISSPIGGLAGGPMRMGFGARGIAIGNALTAVTDGKLDAYYNPAVLPFVSSPTFNVSYCVLSLDRKLNFLSYSNRIKPSAGISLSLINSGVGNIDGRNYDGLHTQDYITSENSFMLSFALNPAPTFSVGITAKILYYSLLEDIKSTTASLDFGTLIFLPYNFTLGIVIQDIGAKYKWDTSKRYGLLGNITEDRFPLRKRIGLSWKQKGFPLLASGEFEYIGSSSFIRLGSEYEIINGLHLRGGIDQIAINSDVSAKPAIGFSFEKNFTTWAPSIQYAFVFEPYSPSGINVITISIVLK